MTPNQEGKGQINLEERLDKCRSETIDSNCIGAALYLIGAIEEERIIDPDVAYEQFVKTKLKKEENPSVGDLLVWQDRTSQNNVRIFHMAVIKSITQEKPILVHRPGIHKELEENVSFEEANHPYRWYNTEYYSLK